MKTISLLFAIIVVFGIKSYAQKIPSVHVTSHGTERIYVLMSSVIETPVDVKIYTEEGELAHSSNAVGKVKNYKKLFNLKNLDNGNYLVEVVAGKACYENKILKSDAKIKLVERKVTFEPHFSFSNDMLKLAYRNSEKENVSVSIKKDGQVYHESVLGNQPVVIAKYNLKNLDEGLYEICLASQKQSYQYLVEK